MRLIQRPGKCPSGGQAGPGCADGGSWGRERSSSSMQGWPFPPPWAMQVAEVYPLTEQEGIALFAITISWVATITQCRSSFSDAKSPLAEPPKPAKDTCKQRHLNSEDQWCSSYFYLRKSIKEGNRGQKSPFLCDNLLLRENSVPCHSHVACAV